MKESHYRDSQHNEGSSGATGTSAGSSHNVRDQNYKRFYWLTLAVLFALSAYPLINGVRMAYISISDGAVEPDQYARYVIPYAAMCVAVLIFAAFLPVLHKMKHAPFAIGLAGAYAVFIAVEQFMERIRIKTEGMTLIDPASLSVDPAVNVPPVAVDAWQASLCIVSPRAREQSKAFDAGGRIFYTMADDYYKIHYYLVSFILIVMVCGLLYGIGRMIRTGDGEKRKPLILQGMAAAALVSLCVFANTTAFFRQADPIQTPLASALTCLFFIMLGAAAGVYAGSFLLKKGKTAGLALPVMISVVIVILMYIGEAAMMKGGLYRFGTGWFFDGIPLIALAPVDILVVLAAGAVTWFVLNLARRFEGWPGKRTAVVAGVLCLLVFGTGVAFAIPQADADDGSVLGSYVFYKCLYMNPLSSSLPPEGSIPYIFEFNEEEMTARNTLTGDIERASVRYEDTAVGEDEFASMIPFSFVSQPDISKYRDCRRRAAINFENGLKYSFYTMDGEPWLVRLGDEKIGIWSIYRLKKIK